MEPALQVWGTLDAAERVIYCARLLRRNDLHPLLLQVLQAEPGQYTLTRARELL